MTQETPEQIADGLYSSRITYTAELFEKPSERYPDAAGQEIEPSMWLCHIAGTVEYLRKGMWILTPSDKPNSRIICTDEYFRNHYQSIQAERDQIRELQVQHDFDEEAYRRAQERVEKAERELEEAEKIIAAATNYSDSDGARWLERHKKTNEAKQKATT